MGEYRHRTPKRPRNFVFHDEGPSRLKVGGVLALCILLLYVVISSTGCVKVDPAVRNATYQSLVAWTFATYAILCVDYPERDLEGLCDTRPKVKDSETALESLRAHRLALCFPEPPDGAKQDCEWVGRILESERDTQAVGADP